jgi:hypothetical protein
MLFFGAVALACIYFFGRETYHPVLKRRLQKGPPRPPAAAQLKAFLVIGLLRPVHSQYPRAPNTAIGIPVGALLSSLVDGELTTGKLSLVLFTEPIVGFTCLYVACEFGTLYAFFAAVPYIFGQVYAFSLEQTGLVFLAIVVGCALGTLTCIVCDLRLYRAQVLKHLPNMVPPEHRLYPAMIGSLGLPVALFWYGWTARPDVSWVSPVVAIVPFAWGNLCIFVSLMQYLVDTYHGTTVASASSANSLARYVFGAVFPLFTTQMYSRLGIGWASSLLAFISLALLPVPWVIFKFGKQIRAKSKYETASG